MRPQGVRVSGCWRVSGLFVLGGMDAASHALKSVEIYGPEVTVMPLRGSPGTQVTVAGSNFAANAKVNIFLGADANHAIASGTTDGAGALAAINFGIPSIDAAVYLLTLIDDRSRYPVTFTFIVQ